MLSSPLPANTRRSSSTSRGATRRSSTRTALPANTSTSRYCPSMRENSATAGGLLEVQNFLAEKTSATSASIVQVKNYETKNSQDDELRLKIATDETFYRKSDCSIPKFQLSFYGSCRLGWAASSTAREDMLLTLSRLSVGQGNLKADLFDDRVAGEDLRSHLTAGNGQKVGNVNPKTSWAFSWVRPGWGLLNCKKQPKHVAPEADGHLKEASKADIHTRLHVELMQNWYRILSNTTFAAGPCIGYRRLWQLAPFLC
ncbi:unnamed protein product [Amoebophrya sp. A25]|nr:unnamed protein product [Amoebophrya sp. A25]|eukprot:GSA25T00009654001.1